MKRLFQLLTLCLLLPMTSAAQGWNEAEYKQIEQSIRVPKFADKDYLITKYGAKPANTAAQNRKRSKKQSTSARRRVAVVWSSLPDRSSSRVPSP